MVVPARLSLVTLGVADVAASTAFYRHLGWPLSSASVEGEVSFFRTAGGLLALWDVEKLADDAGVAPPMNGAFRGVTLALNLDSPDAVDDALRAAQTAGGFVVKPAQETPWGGYSGYFADPDGHLWEVVYNPGFPIGPDERPTLP